ncbi:membrane protein [Bacillus sp. FJAT-27916]|uniref:TerC family protein n=1 Tax=Bacillus sp. FJAT-27916 TaxID=1679169 RepID=UPI0006712B75|nr:TerC family protein [Bacillus sp. FJAT-27916]KMY44344.1 membrane protein [Bacillus sp. FJAT-27916]
MEIFGLSVVVLVKIIVIDIVMSGDNAVVIAMAARNLPKELQNKAIFWGTFGAIVLRLLFAAIVVALLDIPYLTLIGGLMLLWISIKLLLPENEQHQEGGKTVWSAVKTIILADAVMSLDNVLALAGASDGHFGAIVLGVIVSIPIIVFGSRLILNAMNKYPIIVYIGAGILAWTAGEMIVSEEKLAAIIPANAHLIIQVILTILTLGIGYFLAKRSIPNTPNEG